MMIIQVIILLLAIFVITLSYKLTPHRPAGPNKPTFALMPKYKKRVRHKLSEEEVLALMSSQGFTHVQQTDTSCKFTREAVAGDLSVKRKKITVLLERRSFYEYELSVEGGWLVAFDTGDHWTMITELGEKLENA